MKRLSLKRRPRAAPSNVEKTPSGISSSQWRSAESLSSSGADDTRLLGMSSAARGRPPLPPPHGSSLDSRPSKSDGASISNEAKPQPAARHLASQRRSPVIEKAETKIHSDQVVMSPSPPQPFPRRRLASFGGVSSPGSLSPFTGLGAYNQNNNGNKPESDTNSHLSSSLGSRGSTGCLRLSPQSSGRVTTVTGLGSLHLQHVREQMVVALQKLKELEEQVKIIPILQVKISVLQEEKRQLCSQMKNLSDNENTNVIWKRPFGTEGSGAENNMNTELDPEGVADSNSTDFKGLRQLAEEMNALERAITDERLQAWHGKCHKRIDNEAFKSIAVGTDLDMNIFSKPSREYKCVHTDQVETRSVATEVSEINLGIFSEQEAELVAQQLLNGALKERICHLEAELKESAFQAELTRLKLELHAAGARNRVDKACSAKPPAASVGTETRPLTRSQGVGNHTDLQDASTGETTEVKTTGVSCEPKTEDICTGPDVPMNQWEIRERVETREMAVGVRVFTRTQGVGTEIKVCDAESNTEVPVEDLGSKKEKIVCHSVGCGEFSVDICCEAKEMVSQGIATDRVRGVEMGTMASPQTASQRTNTVSHSVSRFTNTRPAFSNDSSTNTLLTTQDKHTNTAHTFTRTVSVGSRVRDITYTAEYRTVGVNTASLSESISRQTPETVTKVTRDSGVGFTNIYDNFLVGLKTRNMASGPSRLPDPTKTKSIGVGDGRIQEFSVSSTTPILKLPQCTQLQWDHELKHYIEKMHRLLREHGDLLTGACTDQYASPKPLRSRAVTEGGTEIHPLTRQAAANADMLSPCHPSTDSCKSAKGNPEICLQSGNNSEVKRMIQMLEEQASSALQDSSANTHKPQPLMKKQSGEQSCSSSRKSMKFMKATAGLDPMSAHKHDAEGRRGQETFRDPSQDIIQTRRRKDVSIRGSEGTAKLHRQQRCKFSERMFSACQALKMHLSGDAVLSSRELQDCLHTIQQEWFSVSSHKSAHPDAVGDYLSAFRAVSPSVLQHVANMADGNGNTVLHYSVSHSNFAAVKKLLDSGVCDVNQQNTAGYTPIMLAAIAAVEDPEDMRVVEQLFAQGDVNAKASQAGQTALMLAVSHGKMDMAQALVVQGAQINIQDDEGSTALMCASEHGHADIVKLLLAQPECDATLRDSDESTALSVALEAGHNEIAVLLYAHANFSRQMGALARHSGTFPSSPGGRNMLE
ncbi:KN motif and ankyrin repeat domain-containing protein 1-like [Cololabis saira]|uniref:KN motif and ankyrin repeat domain-containing protein 1-like n=1 Tax=Cololabis saira TaxID=129043 RepID=UPI002AD266FE|nr:KN motif and ankyrin repeat domain-containing protein 1-like [Cololabis saira]